MAADVLEENGLSEVANAVRQYAAKPDDLKIYVMVRDLTAWQNLAFQAQLVRNNSGRALVPGMVRAVRDIVTDPLSYMTLDEAIESNRRAP